MATKTVTKADAGRPVQVRLGDTVIIKLDEPVSAYRWVTDCPGVSSGFEEDPAAGVGGGGKAVFRYKPTSVGRLALEFRLNDRYQSDTAEVCRFTLDITA